VFSPLNELNLRKIESSSLFKLLRRTLYDRAGFALLRKSVLRAA
jgi:hypothetical protein